MNKPGEWALWAGPRLGNSHLLVTSWASSSQEAWCSGKELRVLPPSGQMKDLACILQVRFSGSITPDDFGPSSALTLAFWYLS